MRLLYYRRTTAVNPFFKKSLHAWYYGANPPRMRRPSEPAGPKVGKNFRISPSLCKYVESYAKEHGTTFSALVEECVRKQIGDIIAEMDIDTPTIRPAWIKFKGGGIYLDKCIRIPGKGVFIPEAHMASLPTDLT